MTALTDRIRQWPRAMQWAALAAIGLVLFLVWDSVLRPVADQWNKEADVIQSRVRQVRSGEAVARELLQPQTQGLVAAIGPVRVPPPVADGSKMFNDVVLEVLQKHNASNANFSSRTRGRLPKNALMNVAPGRRIDRLTGDLKFSATPQAAIAIIADLESSPHIESVNTVRMKRASGGRVEVSLSIEAWMQVAEAVAGGTA